MIRERVRRREKDKEESKCVNKEMICSAHFSTSGTSASQAAVWRDT